ncbi:MAG: hypothetical protein GIX03_12420 [Candidatus Eremiobacteraeota bacterium]|nr:hypothetical protein [Candidatus Eremiobacteraeota bacterium]MBC5803769.1 hypothetical protein [Candidatus Eremiobacteraeota bacterium]MBC5821841.1 hypothetical protein [Candidatus Eremiobacteraeota bacterium]
MTDFSAARAIADTVLYEGYLLFPYTASTRKNQMRWQFGVVVPLAYEAAGTGEHGEQQTDILFEPSGAAPAVDVLVRFLHVVARTVEAAQFDGGFREVPSLTVDGTTHVTFDETRERDVALTLQTSPRAQEDVSFNFEGERLIELLHASDGTVAGRVVRECLPLAGVLRATAAPVDGAPLLYRLRVRLENHSGIVAGRERAGVLRTAFVSAHTLLGARDGTFLSPIDPPPYAGGATAALENRHTWPVLVGDAQLDPQRAAIVLSSPIVLSDFPQVAAQTAEAHDGTEIDELLRLGVLGLSDAERAEARATDPRARAIVERAERFDAAEHARIHSAALEAMDAPAPQSMVVNGITVAAGSSVRLQPKRRADAWDMFLAGKTATVRKVHQDLEGKWYAAVTIDDDPASDLHEWYGRAFFYEPDEIEPLGPAS